MPSAAYHWQGPRKAGHGGADRFESSRPSTGCLTADEVMVISVPTCFSANARQSFLGEKDGAHQKLVDGGAQSSGLVL